MEHAGKNKMRPEADGESAEQQLRRQVDDLQRQLREQREHSGAPVNRWKPSPITISALLLALIVPFVGAFFAGYIPLQKRDALVRAEALEHEKELPRMEVTRVGRSSV